MTVATDPEHRRRREMGWWALFGFLIFVIGITLSDTAATSFGVGAGLVAIIAARRNYGA